MVKHIRTTNPPGHPDQYSWKTVEDGVEAPKEQVAAEVAAPAPKEAAPKQKKTSSKKPKKK